MKKRRTAGGVERAAEAYSLLNALSNDLALPLLQIKSGLEVLEQPKLKAEHAATTMEQLNLSTISGLQLIEAYKLVLQVEENMDQPFEPVAIGAVLQDVAHQLAEYAKRYDTNLQVDVQGRMTPIMAHQPSLFAALEVLGYSLIRAQSSQPGRKKKLLVLGAHRGSESLISTGVFGNVSGISDKALRSARALAGKARQPLPGLPAGAASGVLVADMLCSAMWQPLRSAAHNGLNGLATVVPVSKQMQLLQ
jgi:hypothetical protein